MIYRNLFGITRKIRYEDVFKITTHYDKTKTIIAYKIYTSDCKIKVDYLLENFNYFSRNIKKRLKKAKNNLQF